MVRLITLCCLVSISLLVSCAKKKVPTSSFDPNCTTTISFSNQVQPILMDFCLSCHSNGNATGYTFENYTQVESNATKILNSLKAEGGSPLMPQGGPALHDTLIQQFACWINQGKQNN